MGMYQKSVVTLFGIYLLGPAAGEYPTPSLPIRRLPADFLGWASPKHDPCRLDLAEGNE